MPERVGLIVVTLIENGAGGEEKAAVLQRRGTYNFEKRKPESYPGGCQLTVTGKIERSESPSQALEREIGEELGREFRQNFFERDVTSKLLFFGETGERAVWGTFLCVSTLRQVTLHPSSGGFVLVSERGLQRVKDLSKCNKGRGVRRQNQIAMFSDELEFVKLAFAKLKTPQGVRKPEPALV